MSWIDSFEKGIWFGFAALGFAVLFNVPVRTLLFIFVIGALGGLMKTFLLLLGFNIIIASLGGAFLLGIISIYAAHAKHAPPLVFVIPSVMPMIPGVFVNKMMLGIMKLSAIPGEQYPQILAETFHNGLNAAFILLALALGVTLPLLITRKESIKK